MSVAARVKKAVKRIVLGPSDFPQQYPVGMRDPQSEVIVRLHGLGAPHDVTCDQFIAAVTPLTIGISTGAGASWIAGAKESSRLSLRFYERQGSQRLMGEIRIRFSSVAHIGSDDLYLFRVRGSRNYCLPRHQIWGQYLYFAYFRWRAPNSDVRMTARDVHAMCVFYICPRPVGLVAVAQGDGGNIFPMNLMGPVGKDHFAFALNTARAATSLVERVGRIALSNVPLEQSSLAFGLAKNHRKDCVEWSEFPFATKRSSALGFPVPGFSLGVRELEIEAVQKMGSHTLFLARTIRTEHWADEPEFFMVHGIYQGWRQRHHVG